MQTKDSTTYYVFEAQTVEKWQVESSILQDDIFNVIAFVNNNNEIEVSLLKIKPHKESPVQDYSFFNLGNFGGMLYFYNLEGELPLIAYWEDGQMVESIENELIPKNKLHFSTAKCAQKVVRDLKLTSKCNSLDPDCDSNPLDPCRGGGGGYVPVVTYYYTDWYKIYSNGDSEYTYTQYNGSTTEYVYVSNPDGGDYSQSAYSRYNYYANGGGGYYSSNTDDNIKRLYNNLTGKAKCVYDLLVKSGSNLFKETVEKFDGDAKYHLILQNGDCSGAASACTNTEKISTTGEVTITVDTLSESILEDAALILHEAIHAELARYVQRYKSGEDPNNRARMFQLYKYYKELEVPEKHFDHPYMSMHYINPIASALQKLDGFKYPIDYYKSFAWDGLRDWDVSNLLGLEEDKKYSEYRNIVNSNTSLSCD
ncbi:hypothetical protein [Snuella lapsa]|uniref:Uncharacterized protein n=1 Tax=Snuella lapsa TaxID=870481 RepID=A0ABP6XNZ8_9FLAO